MAKHKPFDIEIDKLTRSIENAITGDSFKTQVLELTTTDIKSLKKLDWLFDWKTEARQSDKKVYKLVIIDNPTIIQALISLQDCGDHIFPFPQCLSKGWCASAEDIAIHSFNLLIPKIPVQTYLNALKPVTSMPVISKCTSCVPS